MRRVLDYNKYTDKVLVRDYVQAKVGEIYLNKIYCVHNNFSDINFEVLPQKFVIKTNEWVRL